MFGDTATVTLGGSGGTAVVAPKINQDAYTSEYLKKRTDDEVRVQIRHSKDTVKAGTQPFDRHTVTFTQYVYPTEDKPLGVTRQCTFILRTSPTDVEADVIDLGEAMAYWASATNLGKLFGWES